MRYLIDVWFKPGIELSALDELTMAVEIFVAFIAVVVIKVTVVDRLRGVKYYRG